MHGRYDHLATAECRHCGKGIRYVDSPLGGAWQHVASISIYCLSDADVTAEPR